MRELIPLARDDIKGRMVRMEAKSAWGSLRFIKMLRGPTYLSLSYLQPSYYVTRPVVMTNQEVGNINERSKFASCTELHHNLPKSKFTILALQKSLLISPFPFLVISTYESTECFNRPVDRSLNISASRRIIRIDMTDEHTAGQSHKYY